MSRAAKEIEQMHFVYDAYHVGFTSRMVVPKDVGEALTKELNEAIAPVIQKYLEKLNGKD